MGEGRKPGLRSTPQQLGSRPVQGLSDPRPRSSRVADVSAFEVRVEWLDAPDVSTPELAATWARYEVWVDDRCVTQVESDSTFRRGVYGSLYPLAEWLVANWWFLTKSVRPSATSRRYWTWLNVQRQSWLRNHNMRGAGNGMAWPDVTVVPEGAMTSIKWSADRGSVLGPVRFMSSGHALCERPSDADRACAGCRDHTGAARRVGTTQDTPRRRLECTRTLGRRGNGVLRNGRPAGSRPVRRV